MPTITIDQATLRQALHAAGYELTDEPLETQVRLCFGDYVDAGVWSDVTHHDAVDFEVSTMAKALIRYCTRR